MHWRMHQEILRRSTEHLHYIPMHFAIQCITECIMKCIMGCIMHDSQMHLGMMHFNMHWQCIILNALFPNALSNALSLRLAQMHSFPMHYQCINNALSRNALWVNASRGCNDAFMNALCKLYGTFYSMMHY